MPTAVADRYLKQNPSIRVLVLECYQLCTDAGALALNGSAEGFNTERLLLRHQRDNLWDVAAKAVLIRARVEGLNDLVDLALTKLFIITFDFSDCVRCGPVDEPSDLAPSQAEQQEKRSSFLESCHTNLQAKISLALG